MYNFNVFLLVVTLGCCMFFKLSFKLNKSEAFIIRRKIPVGRIDIGT